MLFNLIKYQYHIFKKHYSKNHIFALLEIMNFEEKLLFEFCQTFLLDKAKEYHDTFYNDKYKSNFYYFGDNDLFYFLDLIFEGQETISNFENTKDFSEKLLSKEDIFSYILKYLFTFRANKFDKNDLKLHYIYDHEPAFWLSINILYLIYHNYNDKIEKDIFAFEGLLTFLIEEENYKKENNKMLNKKRNFGLRRRIILNSINEKMVKLNIVKETVEKGIFRHFLVWMKEYPGKGDNDDLKKIINKHINKLKKLKDYKQYNSDRAGKLFEEQELCNLYNEFKKDSENIATKLCQKTKKGDNSEHLAIYKFYVENFDLIFNLKLNLEENFPNSSSNNIKNNTNSSNHLLNNNMIQNEDNKAKISNCIHLDEKKESLEINNNLSKNIINIFGHEESSNQNSLIGLNFNNPHTNYPFGINGDDENTYENFNNSFSVIDFLKQEKLF